MDSISLTQIIIAFIEKMDPVTSALIFVIFVLAWLLWKSLGRMDAFFTEIKAASNTMNTLTSLLHQLVYGNRKDSGG